MSSLDAASAAELMEAIHSTRLAECRNMTDYIRTFYARVLAWERVKAPWSLCDDVYQLWFLQGLTPDFQSWKTTIYRTKNVGRIGSSSLPETSLDELCQLAADHAETFELGAAAQEQPQIIDTRRALTAPSPSPSLLDTQHALVRLKQEHEEEMMRRDTRESSETDTEEVLPSVVPISRPDVPEDDPNHSQRIINNISNTHSKEVIAVDKQIPGILAENWPELPATSVIVEIRGQKRRLGMDVVRRYNGGLIPNYFTMPKYYPGKHTKVCPLHGWRNNRKNHDEKTCKILLNWDEPHVTRIRTGSNNYMVDDVEEEGDDENLEEPQQQRMANGHQSQNPDTSPTAVVTEEQQQSRSKRPKHHNRIYSIPFDARPDEMQICSIHGWWKGKSNHGDATCKDRRGAFQTRTSSNPFKRQRVNG